MACFAPLVLLSVFGLVFEPGGFSVFFALIVFGLLYLLARPRPSDLTAPFPCAPSAEIVQVSNADPAPAPETSEAVRLAAEAAKVESLVAIKRATQAREADKKRETPIEDPLARWKESTPKPVASYDVTESKGKSIVHGKRLDVIRFDYIDAKGEFSSRRVKVTMVGKWNFEGIDLHKREERTFRHDRVCSDVTSELTGEVLDPAEWASSIITVNG